MRRFPTVMTASIGRQESWSIGFRRSGSRLRWTIVTVGAVCAATLLVACAEVPIARAKHQMATGDYVSAHEYFAKEATRADQLSPSQRTAVLDGLCVTEYRIGSPAYSLARQLRTCTAAVNQPGSQSAAIFAEVARKERDSLAKRINTALTQQDIVDAEDGILDYRLTPGSDPRLSAAWTRKLWTIVNRHVSSGHVARPTISELSRRFRQEQTMSNLQFRRWIEKNLTVAGNLIVSDVEVRKRRVDLWLPDNQLGNAALNLDRLARINDGLVARCRCNAFTTVELKDSGLPAYLVRIDPASDHSEVLILDQHRHL
jgi:hypothetical protein